MRLRKFLFLVACALPVCGCATIKMPEPASELLVRGRLENLDYESTNDPDDLIGHGWFNARLHISSVLRGHVSQPTIDVRYFAHTYLAQRPRKPWKLYRDDDGKYVICGTPGSSGFVCPSDRKDR